MCKLEIVAMEIFFHYLAFLVTVICYCEVGEIFSIIVTKMWELEIEVMEFFIQ